jgi:hypothetical protein
MPSKVPAAGSAVLPAATALLLLLLLLLSMKAVYWGSKLHPMKRSHDLQHRSKLSLSHWQGLQHTWDASIDIYDHVKHSGVVETGAVVLTKRLPVNLLHTQGMWNVCVAGAAGTACLATGFWQG